MPHSALMFVVAVLGLIVGSFVTALSYRLPRGLDFTRGRSKCPACGHALTVADLVPVLSWIASRGACRYCGVTVSWRYPAIEALTAALFVADAAATDGVRLGVLLVMTATMIALAVIDLEHWRLPNALMILLAVLAFLWRWFSGHDLLAAFVAAGVLLILGTLLNHGFGRLLAKPGFGMGDTKLLAIAGLALSLGPLLLTVAFASLAGLVFGLIYLRKTGSNVFPFGPAILASLWLGLLWGDQTISGLQHLLGD